MSKLSKEPSKTVFPRPVSTPSPLPRQSERLQNKTQRMREEKMLQNTICVVAEVHHSANHISLVIEQQSVEEPIIEQLSVEEPIIEQQSVEEPIIEQQSVEEPIIA